MTARHQYSPEQNGAKASDAQPALKTTARLGWLLDSSVRLPGGYRIGLDGLLGLVPVVGDLAGGALSTWVFYQATKLGAPKSVQLRMIFNILIDALLGSIPVVGDLFDFAWKANNKNVALLERYLQAPVPTQKRATVTNVLFTLAAVVCIGLALWAAVSLVSLLWQRVAAA